MERCRDHAGLKCGRREQNAVLTILWVPIAELEAGFSIYAGTEVTGWPQITK